MKHLELVPGTIWLTGITASGKTTLGNLLFNSLKFKKHTAVIGSGILNFWKPYLHEYDAKMKGCTHFGEMKFFP